MGGADSASSTDWLAERVEENRRRLRDAAFRMFGSRSEADDGVQEPEDGLDPEHEALLAESAALALVMLLETLQPAERLAFVLHDLFAVPFDDVAAIIDQSPAAARRLVGRARRRVRGAEAAPPTTRPGCT